MTYDTKKHQNTNGSEVLNITVDGKELFKEIGHITIYFEPGYSELVKQIESAVKRVLNKGNNNK